MEQKELTKMNIIKPILKITLKILWNLLLVMCVFLIVIIVMQKVTDSNKSIGGYRIFRVVTGSMLPEYEIGEVVICKETPIDNLKLNQTIVYRGHSGELKDKIIMHKLVEIYEDEKGEKVFKAKGTMSTETDPEEIRGSQIYGVVKIKAGVLTFLYKLATNIYSAFIIIVILVVNVFISFKYPKQEIVKNSNKTMKKQIKNKQEEIYEEFEEIDDMETEKIEEVKEDDETEEKNDIKKEVKRSSEKNTKKNTEKNTEKKETKRKKSNVTKDNTTDKTIEDKENKKTQNKKTSTKNVTNKKNTAKNPK